MKQTKETAGKTADTQTHEITIAINGEDYANLQRIADAMNSVEWCCDDNTPQTILTVFMLWLSGYDEMCEYILDAIDTGCDDDTAEGEKRKCVLKKAFSAARRSTL